MLILFSSSVLRAVVTNGFSVVVYTGLDVVESVFDFVVGYLNLNIKMKKGR